MTNLYHGGAPGLRIGDLIQPGHSRDDRHPGCPVCAARARGEAHEGIDGPAHRRDRVYLTEDRDYARWYASLYGRGDLYMVEPVGEIERSEEDEFPTVVAPAARVVAVLARAVLLRPSERRRIAVKWGRLEGLTRNQALDEHRAQLAALTRRLAR